MRRPLYAHHGGRQLALRQLWTVARAVLLSCGGGVVWLVVRRALDAKRAAKERVCGCEKTGVENER